jgi:hypothetical protein
MPLTLITYLVMAPLAAVRGVNAQNDRRRRAALANSP